MNILMIASWYPTSESPLNGIFFQERARALAREGCTVNVAVADVRFRMGSKRSGIAVTNSHGIMEYYYVKRNWTPFWEVGIAYQQKVMLRRIYKMICERSGKPDIIHLESAKAAMAAVTLARETGIPLVYTEHNSGILDSAPGSFRDWLMCMARDYATHTFCISSAVKERINPPEGKWSYLPNAIDASGFTIAEPVGGFTFYALGSLRKIKGYDILLRAFGMVLERYPHCRLVIGGGGEEWENLHALCTALNLDSHVEFRGSILPEKRNDFYSGASAFICSSLTETFSIVTVEALACGIPVIATRCGGPEDIIYSGNGILVEKNNPSALAAGMIQMIENRENYSAFSIREDAIARFGEKSVIRRQLDCYRMILNS